MLLTGPRQCGKSTLAVHALPGWTHLDLERPSDLAALDADLLVVEEWRILPIEIKTGAAVNHHAVAGLRQCMNDLGLRRGWVISTARDKWIRDASIEIRDARPGIRVSGYEFRDTRYRVSRITDPESRIPNFESRLSRTSFLSRSPSTNSDQDQLTLEKWISYICSTRLIHDVTPDLGRQGSFVPGTAMTTASPQIEMGRVE